MSEDKKEKKMHTQRVHLHQLCLKCEKIYPPFILKYQKGCPFEGKNVDKQMITKCSSFQPKERLPDATGKELIEVFLRDWRWGRVYELHFSWLNFYDHCRCKPTIIQYWKWFEDKWEKRLNKE